MKIVKRDFRLPKQRERERERKFEPLAIEIGWISYEWNRLQEAFAELFSDAFEAKDLLAFNVWHSVRSDLTQREMLKAAAVCRRDTSPEEAKPRWIAVIDLINEATALSQRRNDALHVPLIFVTTLDGIEIETHRFFGNPKARKLAATELVEEFNWYRRSLAMLAQYAEHLHYAITAAEHFSLLPKPVLPTRGQSATPKRSRRRRPPKLQKPQL